MGLETLPALMGKRFYSRSVNLYKALVVWQEARLGAVTGRRILFTRPLETHSHCINRQQGGEAISRDG
jgi:hypothetical protein